MYMSWRQRTDARYGSALLSLVAHTFVHESQCCASDFLSRCCLGWSRAFHDDVKYTASVPCGQYINIGYLLEIRTLSSDR